MSERRMLHVEPPLTDAEKTPRDHKTRIQIEHESKVIGLAQDWVKESDGGNYGYAERRAFFTRGEAKVDVTVAGTLDTIALLQVVLAEITRQQEACRAKAVAIPTERFSR
jgi:hypothetical protein